MGKDGVSFVLVFKVFVFGTWRMSFPPYRSCRILASTLICVGRMVLISKVCGS